MFRLKLENVNGAYTLLHAVQDFDEALTQSLQVFSPLCQNTYGATSNISAQHSEDLWENKNCSLCNQASKPIWLTGLRKTIELRLPKLVQFMRLLLHVIDHTR